MTANVEILQKGHKYNVYFHDCCVSGAFEGIFERFIADDKEITFENAIEEYAQAVFDTGIIRELWADIYFEEINEVP